MLTTFFLITLFLFAIGAVVGSFVNVLIYRSLTGEKESWVWGRSKCEECGKKIAWYDNIPLLSFLWLSGKCRHCHKSISLLHPVVEFLLGTLFVWWYWGGAFFFQLSRAPFQTLQPLFWLIVGILLLVVLIVDSLYLIIPDTVVVALFTLTLAYRLFLTATGVMFFPDLVMTLVASVAAVGFFWFLWWVTKGKGMGLGDVKLVAALGLLLGWPKTFIGLFLAFILGAVIGIILLALGKKKFGQVIPFGPFLVVGTMLALLFGNQLASVYLSLL